MHYLSHQLHYLSHQQASSVPIIHDRISRPA
jgi:hypothetical protein